MVQVNIKKEEETFTVTPELILRDRPVKPISGTCHVFIPKKFEGKKCTILIHD